jgi:hypothetical protein
MATAAKLPRLKSLALTVSFKQPDFGMKEYEMLSRATAFLLGVDPPEEKITSEGPFAHLEASQRLRELRGFQLDNKYTPAAGGSERPATELGWLEVSFLTLARFAHFVLSIPSALLVPHSFLLKNLR